MSKFLYCMMCNHGFKLDTKKIGVCKCGNLRGKYRSDGRIAEINAENPAQARFIGIPNTSNPRFEQQKSEFLNICDDNSWEKWEKDHLVHSMDDWEDLLRQDYCIGTADSLKKCNWHHRWVYCQCLCFHD